MGGSDSQVDIYRSTVDGTVAETGFQGQEVKAVFIGVGRISVAQGVRTKAAVHAKLHLLVKNGLLEPLFIHRFFYVGLLGKKPGLWAHMGGAGIPVTEDIPADTFRNGDVPVRMIFGYGNVDPLIGKGNIVAFQMA